MLIGAFTPMDGWAGKTVEYSETSEHFTVQDHGPLTAQQVLKFEAVGHLAWASEEARALVESRLASEKAAAHREAIEAAQREEAEWAAHLAAMKAASERGQEAEGEVRTTTLAGSAGHTSVRIRGVWCYLLASSRPPLRTLTKPGWDVDFRADEVVILRNNKVTERMPYREISRLQVIGVGTEVDRDSFVLGGGAPLVSPEKSAEFTMQSGKPGGIWLEANSVSYLFGTDQETGDDLRRCLSPVFAALREVHGGGADARVTGGAGDMVEHLERLANLREKDMLTDEEFAALKAKLVE